MENGTGAKAQRGGRARFAFATDFQLKKLREVLHQNWKRLPPEVDSAPRIDLGVVWSERAGVRRVVTDRAAELLIERERTYLPYQVCLSELLFGAPLYTRRREVLGLPPIEPAKTAVTTVTPVGTTAPAPRTAPSGGGGASGGRPGSP